MASVGWAWRKLTRIQTVAIVHCAAAVAGRVAGLLLAWFGPGLNPSAAGGGVVVGVTAGGRRRIRGGDGVGSGVGSGLACRAALGVGDASADGTVEHPAEDRAPEQGKDADPEEDDEHQAADPAVPVVAVARRAGIGDRRRSGGGGGGRGCSAGSTGGGSADGATGGAGSTGRRLGCGGAPATTAAAAAASAAFARVRSFGSTGTTPVGGSPVTARLSPRPRRRALARLARPAARRRLGLGKLSIRGPAAAPAATAGATWSSGSGSKRSAWLLHGDPGLVHLVASPEDVGFARSLTPSWRAAPHSVQKGAGRRPLAARGAQDVAACIRHRRALCPARSPRATEPAGRTGQPNSGGY